MDRFHTGDMVEDAQGATATDRYGNKQYIVSLKLTDDGAKIFGEVTTENIGKNLPIVYDGETISYPQVQSAITGGEAQITGMSSFEEADNLATGRSVSVLFLYSFPGVRILCCRSTVGKPGNLYQFKGSSDRSSNRYGLYDHYVSVPVWRHP